MTSQLNQTAPYVQMPGPPMVAPLMTSQLNQTAPYVQMPGPPMVAPLLNQTAAYVQMPGPPMVAPLIPSTTEVHRQFVNEPIRSKPVTAIPEIGPTTAVYFNRDNIIEASQILGYFLFIKQDAVRFMEWLSRHGCNNGQQQAIYGAINEYAQKHVL